MECTLENLKFGSHRTENGRALHLPNSAWQNLHKHLERKKILQEEMDREQKRKDFLKSECDAMTKNWDNSVDNIRKRKEELRVNTIERVKNERMEAFFKLRDEQKLIKEKYIEDARKKLFMSSGHPKNLTSALIESEIYFERDKQLDFQKAMRRIEEMNRKKEAESLKEKGDEEKLKEEEEKKQKEEKNRKFGADLKKYIDLNLENKTNEKLASLKRETEDNRRANEEIALLTKLKNEQKDAERKRLFLEEKKHLKKLEEMQKQMQQDDQELEAVLRKIQEDKFIDACNRKIKTKQLLDAKIKARADMAEKLAVAQKDYDAVQDAIIRTAIAEKQKIEEDKIIKRAEFEAKMKRDRLEDRAKVLERKALENRKEEEIKKWELLNRYKTNEMLEKYDLKRKEKCWANILEYRNELLRQIADDAERHRQEKCFEGLIDLGQFEREDKQFFAYAEEVLKLAKRKGRSTYPIEKAIAQFKKEHHIRGK